MKIFVIGGLANCGKNSFGKFLCEELKNYGCKPCIMQFSEPLYSYARNYFDWDSYRDPKPREFLQKMGIEIIQNRLHKKYFLIDRLCEDISILSCFFDTFIITDARMILEFTELKKRFSSVVSIYLYRKNYDDGLTVEEREHITEKEILQYDSFDYRVLNSGFDKLKDVACKIAKEQMSQEEII